MRTVKTPMESLRGAAARGPGEEEEAILGSTPPIPTGPSHKQLIARSCVGLAGLGLVAALACAAWAHSASSPSSPSPDGSSAKSVLLSPKTEEVCDYTKTISCPAEGLLRSLVIFEGVAESIEDVALLPTDQSDAILGTVRGAFANISAQLQQHAPEMAEGFKHLQIKKIEQEGVVASLGLLSDSEIQSIGRYIAGQLQQQSQPSEDTEDLKRYIQQVLQPRLHEMEALRNRIVPTSVRALWGEGQPELMRQLQRTKLQMTVDRYNMRGLRAPQGAEPLDADSGAASTKPSQGQGPGFPLFAAALQEGRVVLDMLQMQLQRSSDPSLDSQLHGTLDFGSPAWDLPCKVEDPAEETEEVEAPEQVYCKLKFGAMGLDALRSTLIEEMSAFA